MALERLSQITESGIKTGITLSNASVTGVLTATSEFNVGSGLTITSTSSGATLTSSAVTVTGNSTVSGNSFVNGSLGIGENTPLNPLHILVDTANTQGFTETTNGGGIFLESNSTSSALGYGAAINFTRRDGSSHRRKAAIVPKQFTADGESIGLSFFTANGNYSTNSTVGEVLTLHSNGNIGVGSISPQSKLDVAGEIRASGIAITESYPTIRPSLNLNFANSRSLDPRITFTRASTATYVGRDGLIKTAGEGEARFDHDPVTLESLGLLIEESRTNILGLSADLTDNNGNDWDNVNGTIAVNQTTAPDGTNTAASFTTSAGNAEHSVVWAELVPTGNVTASVWVKPNTYSIVSFVLYGEPNSIVSYNLSTKTVYNQASNVSRATITEYPNGWYRISATMNCTVANSRAFRLYASTGNFDASGTESFYYWGPQVEAGSFETSYIPTYVSNTSVTRAADTGNITGESFSSWFNQTEGTYLVGAKPIEPNNDTAPPYFFIFESANSGDFSNTLSIGKNNTDHYRFRPTKFSDLSDTSVAYTTNQFTAAVSGSGTNDGVAVLNGSIVATSTGSPAGTQDHNVLCIGDRFGSTTTGHYNGTISKLVYYPKRLTNAQLIALTS